MSDVLPLALNHEHAFDIRINFDRRWTVGPFAGGLRHGYTSIGVGSTVTGPLLNGTLVDHSGADWPVIRPDGVVELNAHYMIQTGDGALIYIHNKGYVHGPLRTSGQPEDEAAALPSYFRCTPYFRAPDGPYEWLNRTVIVGVGVRRPKLTEADEADHSLFRYFAIR